LQAGGNATASAVRVAAVQVATAGGANAKAATGQRCSNRKNSRPVATATTTGAPTVTTAGGYKVYLFEASGTIEF
jgi:hypothetical protein